MGKTQREDGAGTDVLNGLGGIIRANMQLVLNDVRMSGAWKCSRT
jgi:hypothetical protein